MKVTSSSILLISAVLLCAAAPVFGQLKHPDPSTFKRLTVNQQSNLTEAQKANLTSNASGTLPLWTYSVVSAIDGKTYTGNIVGRNPYFNGHRGTTVTTYVVPLVVTFSSQQTFDPTANDPCLGDSVIDLIQGSPVFTNTDWNLNGTDIGTTQYNDAYERADFWSAITRNGVATPYHTLLGYKLLPAVQLTVPSNDGYVNVNSCPYGVVDYTNWMIPTLENTVIPNLTNSGQISPTGVVVFVTDSIVMYLNGVQQDCCATGAHGVPSGSSQTYVLANYDSSGYWDADVSILSDELGKWMNDPLVANATPAFPWGTASKGGSACETILEVGDPLTGYVIPTPMPNGNTYNVAELAFFSWFFDQQPSIAANGWYSFDDTLTSPNTSACQGSSTQPSTSVFSAAAGHHVAGALAR